MKIRLIGVDCATDDARVGLALGSLEGARVNVERAVLCTRKDSALLAAADFLRGEAMPPEDQAIAEREGWIWVRAPKRRGAK